MATQILFNPCERSSPSQLSVCSLKAKRMPRIQLPHNNNVPTEAGAERGQSILVSLAPWFEGGVNSGYKAGGLSYKLVNSNLGCV